MSYCRFSSDDFRCDLYVYESYTGEFITHVAGNKCRGYIPRVLPAPPYRWVSGTTVQRLGYWLWGNVWAWSMSFQSWYMRWAPRKFYKIPHAGAMFRDADAAECAKTVRMLIGLGYRVPAKVLVALEGGSDE